MTYRNYGLMFAIALAVFCESAAVMAQDDFITARIASAASLSQEIDHLNRHANVHPQWLRSQAWWLIDWSKLLIIDSKEPIVLMLWMPEDLRKERADFVVILRLKPNWNPLTDHGYDFDVEAGRPGWLIMKQRDKEAATLYARQQGSLLFCSRSQNALNTLPHSDVYHRIAQTELPPTGLLSMELNPSALSQKHRRQILGILSDTVASDIERATGLHHLFLKLILSDTVSEVDKGLRTIQKARLLVSSDGNDGRRHIKLQIQPVTGSSMHNDFKELSAGGKLGGLHQLNDLGIAITTHAEKTPQSTSNTSGMGDFFKQFPALAQFYSFGLEPKLSAAVARMFRKFEKLPPSNSGMALVSFRPPNSASSALVFVVQDENIPAMKAIMEDELKRNFDYSEAEITEDKERQLSLCKFVNIFKSIGEFQVAWGNDIVLLSLADDTEFVAITSVVDKLHSTGSASRTIEIESRPIRFEMDNLRSQILKLQKGETKERTPSFGRALMSSVHQRDLKEIEATWNGRIDARWNADLVGGDAVEFNLHADLATIGWQFAALAVAEDVDGDAPESLPDPVKWFSEVLNRPLCSRSLLGLSEAELKLVQDRLRKYRNRMSDGYSEQQIRRYPELIIMLLSLPDRVLTREDRTEVFTKKLRSPSWDEFIEFSEEVARVQDRLCLRDMTRRCTLSRNFSKDKLSSSLAIAEQIVSWFPDTHEGYMERGQTLLAMKEPKRAGDDLTTALRLCKVDDKDRLHVLEWRARAYVALRDYGKAKADYLQAIEELNPPGTSKPLADAEELDSQGELVPLLCEAAKFLTMCDDDKIRNGQDAVQLAERACELSKWKSDLAIATLAGAFAEVGEFEKAVTTQRKAIAAAQSATAKASLESQLNQYLMKKTLRHERDGQRDK